MATKKNEATPLVKEDSKPSSSSIPTALCLAATFAAGILTTVCVGLAVWAIGQFVLKRPDDTLIAASAVGLASVDAGASLLAPQPMRPKERNVGHATLASNETAESRPASRAYGSCFTNLFVPDDEIVTAKGRFSRIRCHEPARREHTLNWCQLLAERT